MDIETKLELIKRSPTEEIITENELIKLLKTNEHPKHYIGLEISGLLHLGTLFVTGSKIKDLLEVGCECIAFLADWHSWINEKLGGDLNRIKKAAEYFEEGFRFFLKNHKRLKIILGSELYHNNDDYWAKVIKISKSTTLSRVTRCLTIMGRREGETLDFSQFIYPPLQSADIWELDVDIAHAGMDQRKVHVLHREIAEKLKIKKPVALHTHLLAGLSKPRVLGYDENVERDRKISSKMSKSKPWTCIFINDTEKQIKEKLNKAWCPEKVIENNPVLELVKYVIFREMKTFEIEREQKYGGNLTFESYNELENEFRRGNIHPQDLKQNVAREINKIIEPIRKHFEKPKNRKLLEVFKEAEITR